MEIFTDFYNFFGFDLLTESATLVDLINNLVQIGLGLFITCFFIKALLSVMVTPFKSHLME